MKNFFLALLGMATIQIGAQEEPNNKTWKAGRPDGHAPISVMGDHMHGKGEWMFSYRFMNMNMDELQQGSDNATFNDALAQTLATPTRMPMRMHMIGTMYAPSNKVTLMAMLSYRSLEMDHITRMGGTFTTEASGFGDLQLAGLYQIFNAKKQTLHAQLGISIPTGSVNESDVIPASAPNEVELPYPMQIGSGTFDSNLALTYLGQDEFISWGSQLKGIFRLGTNNREFRYGNRYTLNNWFALKAANWLSFSARIEGLVVSEIVGEDPILNPMMVITADTNNSGGTFINSGIGLNTYIPSGKLKNFRFGVELAYPLYQDVNGIQLRTKETFTVGTQYAF